MKICKKSSVLIRCAVFSFMLISTAIFGSLSANEIEHPGQQKYNYNEHTPSFHTTNRGMRAYQRGDHASAFSDFKLSAVGADKFAQYNIGIMYLLGEGTDYDPTRAWAWIELSAERGYPQLVDVADKLWDLLSEPEQQQAMRIYQRELLPKYGDDIAIEKTASRMRREFRSTTGSRVGSSALVPIRIIDNRGNIRQGDEYYSRDKWNFEQIVAYETQIAFDLLRGRVELGEFRVEGEDTQD